MEEKLNINEIVKVEQLPKIFEQLEKVGKTVDEELSKLKDLEATEENKNEVKKVRTGINNTLKEFETKRQEIKSQCLETYTKFEEKYNIEVKDKLTNASDSLKEQIDEIESKQINEKKEELEAFIRGHIINNNLDNFMQVDDVIQFAELKINLSTSLKSLKDDSLNFIERVVDEVKLIELEEYSDEVLLEYQKNFNYVNAKLVVNQRHIQLEKLKEQQKQKQEIEKEEEKVIEKVEEVVVVPKEIISEEEVIQVTFTVKGEKSKIKQVKDLIVSLGLEYE